MQWKTERRENEKEKQQPEVKEKRGFGSMRTKVFQRKYLIFHFALFFSFASSPIHLFECDKKRDEWKNSIICKWFAFNRSHYSKGKAKEEKNTHTHNPLFFQHSFVASLSIWLCTSKAPLRKWRESERKRKKNVTQNHYATQRLSLLITTFCHCSTQSIMFYCFLQHRK